MARIAHVGYGYWGRNLARNFAELGALAAIIDGSPWAAAEAETELGVPGRVLEDVLSDDSIDGISLASPAPMHARQALEALAAGKHVFVEKPLALSIADARAVCEAADRAERHLMVGHLMQYHPVFARLRAMVEGGELGKVHYAYSNRLSLGKFRNEENVMWSFAPHDLSMLLSLFREEPSSVTAQGSVSFLPGIADFTSMQLHFPSGGSAHILSSWMHPFKEQRLVVIGEKMAVVFEDSHPKWEKKLAIYRHSYDLSGPVPAPIRAEAEYVAIEKSEPLKNECAHFLDCISQNKKPLTDGREGLRVLSVLQAAEVALSENLAKQGPRG